MTQMFCWKRKREKIKFSNRWCKKNAVGFCSKYKIRLSDLEEILEKIGLNMPIELTYLRKDTFRTDTGIEIILNRDINPDMFSHIVVIKDGVYRGYDLLGQKNKIIVPLKYGEKLSCSFISKKGYNIYLASKGYISLNDLFFLKNFLGLKSETFEEIEKSVKNTL